MGGWTYALCRSVLAKHYFTMILCFFIMTFNLNDGALMFRYASTGDFRARDHQHKDNVASNIYNQGLIQGGGEAVK